MNSVFTLKFTPDEIRELLTNHLDDRVFGNSVNPSIVDNYTIEDGFLTVTGHFEED